MLPPRLLRLCPFIAAAAAAPLTAQTPPAAVRAAPTRPAAAQAPWTEARLRGLDFVDLRDASPKLGWKPAWITPGRKLALTSAGGSSLVFELDERDCHLDGVRLFLSERIAAHRDSLWIAKTDFLKTIAPLLRPADHALLLPAAPRVIVLDAGHGGTDPGKSNAKFRLHEKDMTLDVVLRLKELLESRGYRAVLTRKDDTRFSSNPVVDLQRRADFANKAGAELFLSVHFNAVDPKDAARVSGTETYVLTPQGLLSTTDGTKDDLTGVAFPGNRHDLPNVLLGFHLHRRLIGDLKTSDRGYKRARFAVLRFVECPAALIEAAYLSNDEEAARVARPEFRQQVAEAIAKGVDAYARQLAGLAAAKR
ncbi:MAG: N-acetylmuramoyl-L-alanine amidase [Opitutus sp.]|nr:N-acetylmuramoyl-L-alanine amidase [Opitutus sp.]